MKDIKLTKNSMNWILGKLNVFLKNRHYKLQENNKYLIPFIPFSTFEEIQSQFSKDDELYTEFCKLNNRRIVANSKLARAFNENMEVLEVLNILTMYSDNSFLVGGCVRDILLGKEPKDFDFCTDIEYTKLVKIFNDFGYKTIQTGKNFLVLNVSIRGLTFEIANFRKDLGSSDGRHPDKVEIGSIEEDQKRRDFRINSLMFNFDEGLVDYVNGLDDINSRTLKFNGNPVERLKEDYLRGLRFYRLLKSKGLEADPKSLKAVRSNFEDIILKTNPERIRDEIEKLVFS